MTAPRLAILRTAFWLALVSGGPLAHASDLSPVPRPIALETPAYQAPARPDSDGPSDPSPVVEPSGPLALQDALALALMGNPELAMFSWEERASEARTLQAGRSQNPELDIRIYSLGIPRQSADLDETRTRVILSQVFQFGKVGQRRDLARTEGDLAAWDYEAKRIEVATVVTGRFAAVLGAQRQEEVLRRFVEQLEELQKSVATLVDSGTLRSLEIHQIARQLGLARIEHHRSDAELAVARFRLAATWGGRTPKFTQAEGDLEQIAPIPGVDAVIELARDSPSIARWNVELARSEAALDLARTERIPDLNFGVGTRWQDDFSDNDWLVDLEISLPIFDRKRGEVREARYGTERARAGKRAAEATTSETIAELYYTLEESLARRLTVEREILPAARASLEAHSLGFEQTARGLGDLLDARRDLARAEVQYVIALVDYHQALSTLEGILGQRISSE